MAKYKVKVDIQGIREIRKCEGVFNVVDQHVQSIAGRAGDGFTGDTIVGQNRCQGLVKTTDKDSYFRAIHSHTLSKCLR